LGLCVHISLPIGPTGNIPPIYWCCELKVSNGKRISTNITDICPLPDLYHFSLVSTFKWTVTRDYCLREHLHESDSLKPHGTVRTPLRLSYFAPSVIIWCCDPYTTMLRHLGSFFETQSGCHISVFLQAFNHY
jgi:hypothetical protein